MGLDSHKGFIVSSLLLSWQWERRYIISRLIPGNQKHLTLDDRLYIERSLNEGLSFNDISKFLCKDPTTISKQVRLHRIQNTWNRGSFPAPHSQRWIRSYQPKGPSNAFLPCISRIRSNHKGGIENIHTMLRMILPKGTVFESLTGWDIRKIVNHINSAPRANLNGKTPYELGLKKYGPDILRALQLKPIPPDDVTLSPKLLKK